MQYRVALYFIILAWTLFTGLLYYLNPSFAAGLQANLFAGAIDTALAVYVLDLLRSVKDSRETYEYRFNAYLSAVTMLNALCRMWLTIIIASSTSEPPAHSRIFSQENIENIKFHFDSHIKISGIKMIIVGTDSWPMYLSNFIKKFHSDVRDWKRNYPDSHLLGAISTLDRMTTLNMMEFLSKEQDGQIKFDNTFYENDVLAIEKLWRDLNADAHKFRQHKHFLDPFPMNDLETGSALALLTEVGCARQPHKTTSS